MFIFLPQLLLAQDIVNPVLNNISGLTPSGFFGGLIPLILSLIIVVGIVAFLIYLLMGGVSWITSGGDKMKLEQARSRITQALVGLIILLSFIAIARLFESFFGVGFGQIAVGPYYIGTEPLPTIPPSTPGPTSPPGTPTSPPGTPTPPSYGTCDCTNGLITENSCNSPATAICTYANTCQCEVGWTGVVIVRNEATNRNCNSICSDIGRSCIDVGITTGAVGGIRRLGDIPGCRNVVGADCSTSMDSRGVYDIAFLGNIECNWTMCRCQ
ncbi:hypothetical protein ACFL25_00620 [Patescibacteria group bacterium]